MPTGRHMNFGHARWCFGKLLAMRPGFWTLTGRPLWRDWVFGFVLIVGPWGLDPRGGVARVVASASMAAGCAVLVAALVHFFRGHRRDDAP